MNSKLFVCAIALATSSAYTMAPLMRPLSKLGRINPAHIVRLSATHAAADSALEEQIKRQKADLQTLTDLSKGHRDIMFRRVKDAAFTAALFPAGGKLCALGVELGIGEIDWGCGAAVSAVAGLGMSMGGQAIIIGGLVSAFHTVPEVSPAIKEWRGWRNEVTTAKKQLQILQNRLAQEK